MKSNAKPRPKPWSCGFLVLSLSLFSKKLILLPPSITDRKNCSFNFWSKSCTLNSHSLFHHQLKMQLWWNFISFLLECIESNASSPLRHTKPALVRGSVWYLGSCGSAKGSGIWQSQAQCEVCQAECEAGLSAPVSQSGIWEYWGAPWRAQEPLAHLHSGGTRLMSPSSGPCLQPAEARRMLQPAVGAGWSGFDREQTWPIFSSVIWPQELLSHYCVIY